MPDPGDGGAGKAPQTPPCTQDASEKQSPDAKETVAEAIRLLGVSRIGKAHRLLESVADSAEVRGAKDNSTAAGIQRIREVYAQMVETRKLLQDGKGWTTVVENCEGVSTYHRQEPDTPIHSLKVVGVLEAPFVHLLSLIIESDLIPTFIDVVKLELKQLLIKSVYQQLVYVKIPLPWPLYHRDIVLNAEGFDMLEERGEVIVTAKSESTYEDVEFPEVPSRCVRLQIHLGGLMLRPITRTRAEMTLVTNIDFKSMLPTWAINWFAKRLLFYGFKQFRAKAQKVKGSLHEKRILDRKEVYAQVSEPVDAFFERIAREKRARDAKKRERASSPSAPMAAAPPPPRAPAAPASSAPSAPSR